MDVDVHGSNVVAQEQESVEQGSNIRAGDVSDHEVGGSQNSDVSLYGDYLLSGGGFCREESEIQGDARRSSASPVTYSSAVGDGYSSALDCQTRHPCSLDGDDDSYSRDYLLSGGGFAWMKARHKLIPLILMLACQRKISSLMFKLPRRNLL